MSDGFSCEAVGLSGIREMGIPFTDTECSDILKRKKATDELWLMFNSDYSLLGAPTGHASAQAPQSMHFEGSIE